MILNTKRLNIRPFRSDDIEDTFEIYTDADVCRYLLEDEWNTKDKEEFEKKTKNNKLEENSSLNLAVVLDKKVMLICNTKMLLKNCEVSKINKRKWKLQSFEVSTFFYFFIARLQYLLPLMFQSSLFPHLIIFLWILVMHRHILCHQP
ncbi:TPA: GNAT family N-acetyltransferase [Streptococcus suis]|nr:GNAT family N-acetyltransferase [Streptococcus suis]HEM4073964.1 GNAT family N-acetyltransferase [Streptococcus suis]